MFKDVLVFLCVYLCLSNCLVGTPRFMPSQLPYFLSFFLPLREIDLPSFFSPSLPISGIKGLFLPFFPPFLFAFLYI